MQNLPFSKQSYIFERKNCLSIIRVYRSYLRHTQVAPSGLIFHHFVDHFRKQGSVKTMPNLRRVRKLDCTSLKVILLVLHLFLYWIQMDQTVNI